MESKKVLEALAGVEARLEALRGMRPPDGAPLDEDARRELAQALKLLILELECALRALGADFHQDSPPSSPS
jgi:hypothetical protein